MNAKFEYFDERKNDFFFSSQKWNFHVFLSFPPPPEAYWRITMKRGANIYLYSM